MELLEYRVSQVFREILVHKGKPVFKVKRAHKVP
jgi:hypothetical protein